MQIFQYNYNFRKSHKEQKYEKYKVCIKTLFLNAFKILLSFQESISILI